MRLAPLRKIFLAAISLLVSLSLVEVGFRALGVRGSYPVLPSFEILQEVDGPAQSAVWGFIPFATVRTRYATDPRHYFGENGCVDHAHNSAGWRDVERNLIKPDITYRILGLGDSYLYGQGVHREDICLSRLESMLGEQVDFDVECINAGVSATNTAFHRALLDQRGWAYEPDLVMLHFVINDIEADQSDVDFLRNFSAIHLESDWACRISRAWSWSRQRLLSNLRQRRYVDYCCRQYEDDSERWQECQKQLLGVAQSCADHEVPFVLVLFPYFHQLDGGYPFKFIHDQVNAFCEREGIDVLDLRDAFPGHSGPELWVHPTDQHPNEMAHRLAAQAMSQYLLDHREQVRLDQPPRASAVGVVEAPYVEAAARLVQLGGQISPDGRSLGFASRPLADGDLALLQSHWPAFANVTAVDLSDARVSDSTVIELAALQHLQSLRLDGTLVTDECLAFLAQWPNLQYLDLRRTKVTPGGLAKLSANRPDLNFPLDVARVSGDQP